MTNFEKDIKLYFFVSDHEKDLAHDARILMQRKYENQTTTDLSAADVVVALGGDGTFLEAQRMIANYNVEAMSSTAKHAGTQAALLGLAYGTVNNLMNKPANLYSLLSNAQVVNSHPLMVRYSQGNGIYRTQMAFNEAVFHRCSAFNQTCHLDVQAGSVQGSINGDGLNIATPQGCMGYNFQAGGKFIDIWSGKIGLQPICDVRAKKLSRVVSDAQEITVDVCDFHRRPVILNADNNKAVVNVVRCTVQMDKRISVPVLLSKSAPIMRQNLAWLEEQQARKARLSPTHPLAIRRIQQVQRQYE